MPPKKGGKKGAKAAVKEEVPEIELRDPYAGSEELVAQLDAKTIGDRILRLYASLHAPELASHLQIQGKAEPIANRRKAKFGIGAEPYK